MAVEFGVRPSQIIAVNDAFTAYCFDEACLYIKGRLAEGTALPIELAGVSLSNNKNFLASFGRMKGVRFDDKRRNGRSLSDA